MRLDLYLSINGLSKSRTEAQTLIKKGYVKVDNRKVTTPSFQVDDDMDVLRCQVDRSEIKYVSRGGLKLEAALDYFSVDVTGHVCLDVGASSGGFTDCLLQRGAAHVYAVDAGKDQIAPAIRASDKVTVIENYNARYMVADDFSQRPTLATMDVSFISQTLILPLLYNVLSDDAEVITLVKPQFELTKSALTKKGIVKNDALRQDALTRVEMSAKSIGFQVIGKMTSPLLGGDGNIEFLMHLKKEGDKK